MSRPSPVLVAAVVASLGSGATAQQVSAAAPSTGEVVHRVGERSVRRWHDGRSWRASTRATATSPATQLRDPDDRLHLRAAVFDPRTTTPFAEGPLAAPAGSRLFVVQFHTQVLPEHLAMLRAAGVDVLYHVPADAMLVRGEPVVCAVLRGQAAVRWLGPLPNGAKLPPALHAFLGTGDAPRELDLVLAHKHDAAALADAIAAAGGTVTGRAPGSTFVRARVDGVQLQSLLRTDLVVFVDEAAYVGFDMDHARQQGGANHVEIQANLLGQGVRVEITEPLQETHPELLGRVVVRGSNAVDSHGHCTAGIVGADGSGNAAARGMLPAATLIEGGYTGFGALLHFAQATGSTDPSLPWQAMVATASWGSSVNANYTTATQALDDALFVADLPRTQSMSNQGNNLQVRPEAWAKNVIAVGGVFHYYDANPANDAWNGSTSVPPTPPASIGPAADGRLKPDLVAYYDSVSTIDRTGADGYTATDYNPSFSGTSAATPIVAGQLGLALQLYTDGAFGNLLPLPPLPANRFANRPHMATAKALLCNTAAQYAFSGLAHDLTRTHQGWGMPSLQRLYDHRQTILVCDQYDRLTFGATSSYFVMVAPGTPEFRVTLAWPDPAAVPLAAITRVNDLDLQVVRWADGVQWWGNHGLDAGTASTPGGAPNDRDTLESVYLANPLPGLYRIDVHAAQVVADGDPSTPALDVPFALVAHPLGGGHRVPTGLQLTAQCATPGQLVFTASGVPTSGWDEGFTAISATTDRGLGFGHLCGLEFDGLTGAMAAVPVALGDAFHFANVPATYPFVGYTFPLPSLITALAGLRLDVALVLTSAGQPVAVSNVVRVTLQ